MAREHGFFMYSVLNHLTRHLPWPITGTRYLIMGDGIFGIANCQHVDSVTDHQRRNVMMGVLVIGGIELRRLRQDAQAEVKDEDS